MFFRQLEYLVTLAREQHFTRAAEACHVSQPALSSAIRHLEEELGVAIVLRGQRFLGFTPEGKRILAWARQSLAALSGLRQAASAAHEHLTGELRTGAVPTAASVLARLTGTCRAVHPDLNYTVLSLSSGDILRRLDQYELDAGLTYLDEAESDGFRVLPLYRERYMLLVPEDAPETALLEIGWREAASLPLCLLTPNMQNRQLVNSAFRRAAVQPYVVVETDSMTALLAHVRHAGLYSVVPQSLLGVPIPSEGPRLLSLTPDFSRRIGLITRRQDPPAPLPTAFFTCAAALKASGLFEPTPAPPGSS